MRRLIQPRVIIPLLLSAALLAALLAAGNVRRIVAEALAFQVQDLLWFALLFLTYELLRGAQWAMLLRALDQQLPRRSVALSFVAGEITKYLPLGNFFPNYLLRATDRADFGMTSAATTAMILLEVAISLAGVLIYGLGAWSGWLRPLVLVGCAVGALVMAVIYHYRARITTPSWMRRHRTLRTALVELHRFSAGLRRLARPRALALGALICAAYVSTASAALFYILHGLGLTSLSYAQVAGAYCFTLAFALIEPSPIDLGVLELGGVGALLAVGVDTTTAVTAMLINRVFSVVISVAIAAIGLAVLFRTLRRALRATKLPPPDDPSDPDTLDVREPVASP